MTTKILLFMGLLSLPGVSQVPCLAVGPTSAGLNDGSTWANRLGPSAIGSSMTRGTRYYLADGYYGTSLNLTTPANGTLIIELRKAQSYDFGRISDGCSNNLNSDSSWNASTMGSYQARWEGAANGGVNLLPFSGGYYVINGNGQTASNDPVGCGGVYSSPPSTMGTAPGPSGGTTRSGDTSAPPTIKGCGILIDDSTCISQNASVPPYGVCGGGDVGVGRGTGDHVTWEWFEWKGQGGGNGTTVPYGTWESENYFWWDYNGTNGQFLHGYMHNAETSYLTFTSSTAGPSAGWTNGVFAYNYVWGLHDSSGLHSEMIQPQGQTSGPVSIHDNIIRDQKTNGDITAVTSGGAGTHDHYSIYNNLAYCSPGFTCTHNDGWLNCINSEICTNWVVYNNTVALTGTNCGQNMTGSTSSTGTWENNLFYGCGSTGGFGTGFTFTSNSLLNSGTVPSGNTGQNGGAPNPFTNTTSGIYTIASSNALWMNRVSLGSPYDADILGNAYGVNDSKGAYSFLNSGGTPNITPVSFTWTSGQVLSGTQAQMICNSCTAGGTWSVTVGTLPFAGGNTALNSSTGAITGTVSGASTTVTVQYSTGTVTQSVSITVNAVPSITTPSGTLASGQVNMAYGPVTLTTSGGTGVVSCAASGLPPGVTFSSGCTLTGTPSNAASYNFTAIPTDANGVSGSGVVFTIVINPPDTSIPIILHSTFCGPGTPWPASCTIPATTAGTHLYVNFQSYNSAGACTSNCMSSVSVTGGTCRDISGYWTNTAGGNHSWNEWQECVNANTGTTAVTVTTAATTTGNVFVWEVQYASTVSCATAPSQTTSTTPSSPTVSAVTKTLLLADLHPGAAEGGSPSGIHTGNVFVSDSTSDNMAWAHYTTTGSGNYFAQWDQSPTATYASGICAIQSLPNSPIGVNVSGTLSNGNQLVP